MSRPIVGAIGGRALGFFNGRWISGIRLLVDISQANIIRRAVEIYQKPGLTFLYTCTVRILSTPQPHMKSETEIFLPGWQGETVQARQTVQRKGAKAITRISCIRYLKGSSL
jgi:hypothetical protein